MAFSAAPAAAPAAARTSRSAVLRCRACGAHEAVRAPARVRGWQRCSRCATPIVAPWSDAEAFDSPNARTVVIERPGRAHFMVPRRTLLSTLELAAWLFIVNVITAFCVGLFEIEPTPGNVWRWLGPLLCALLGLSLSVFFIRLWNTVQHLEISPRRLVAYRTNGRRRFARTERRFDGDLRVSAEDGVETVSENRRRVRLRTASAEAKPVDLLVPTRTEAEWVATLVRLAVTPEASRATHRCPGCGAPVDVTLERRAEGSVDCDYCEAGFVVDVRELRWGPVTVPCPDPLPGEKPPDRVLFTRRRLPGTIVQTWQVLRGGVSPRLFAALGLASNVLFFGGFGIGMLWVAQRTPPGSIGLPVYIVGGSAMMFGMSAFAAFLIALLLFGREEIGIDDAAVWAGTRLGEIDLSGPWLLPAFDRRTFLAAGWRRSSGAVPVLRLTRVEFEREGAETTLRLATPTRTLELTWALPPESDRWLRREFALALVERLRALGRDVELRDSPASPRRSNPDR